MDVVAQYSLIPYAPSKAVVPVAERNFLQAQPKISPLTSGHRLFNYDSSGYFNETADSSPSRVYTPGSRLSAIEFSKIGSLIDVYA